MADLSLDEIIASKGLNFKVQFQNQNAQKRRFQSKAAQQVGQGQGSWQGFNKPRFVGSQLKVKRSFSAPSQQKKLMASSDLRHPANDTSSQLLGPGKGQIDARDMISIKSRIKISDARTKILLKRLQKGNLDARTKLQPKPTMPTPVGHVGRVQQVPEEQPPLLLQTNTFLAPRYQPASHQFQQPLQGQFQHSAATFQQPSPNFRQQRPQFKQPSPFHQPPHFQQPPQFQQQLCFQHQNSEFRQSLPVQEASMQLDSGDILDFRVALDQSAGGAEPLITRTLRNPLAGGGALVEDTGDSLKITRSIPDVTFDGNRLTVTRRLPQNSDQNMQLENEPDQRESGDFSQVPVFQIHNDKYKMPHTQGPDINAGKNRIAKSSPSMLGNSAGIRTSIQASLSLSASNVTQSPDGGPARSAVQSALPSGSSGVISSNRYSYRSAAAKSGTAIPAPQSGLKPSPISAPRAQTQSALARIQQSGQTLFSRAQSDDISLVAKTQSSRPPVTKRLAPSPSQAQSVTERIKPSLLGQAADAKAGMKRPAPRSLSERFSSAAAGSPIPVITDHAPEKKRRQAISRPAEPAPSADEEFVEDFELREQFVNDVEDDAEGPTPTVLSPLQGYRVLVSNLHASVTQEDIIELFGAIGPLKRANLLQRGHAEVAFIHREHAATAVKKYHNRELDGQPMFVKVITPLNAKVQKISTAEESSSLGLPASLRTSKKSTETSVPVEIPLIHKALFKIGSPSVSKSVRFTVKI